MQETIWYQAFKGKGPLIAASQNDAHRLDLAIHLPMLALVSLMTGDPNASLQSLQDYCGKTLVAWPRLKTVCRCCGNELNQAGLGHSENCPIRVQANEVLKNVPHIETLRTEARYLRKQAIAEYSAKSKSQTAE